MRRLSPTAADYLVIAVTPALIMTLVGSLVYFLLAVFYQGQFELRLTVIMGLFVFASTLISRISMEEGIEYAALFGAPLGVLTVIGLLKYAQPPASAGPLAQLFQVSLLGLIWWCTSKLVWDCTLIDESQDATGEGLLQATGLDRPATDAANLARSNANVDDASAVTSREEASSKTFWERIVDRRKRPHVPGVWVVYFSLAALPLFGIGQWFIPASNVSTRQYVFLLLCIYVASGLGLLVTTSFLGLQRYLRQRRLEMPAPMAASWIAVGSVLIVAVLLFAALLPRPNPEFAISEVPIALKSPEDVSTNRFGPGSDGPRDDKTAARTRGGDPQAEAHTSGSDSSSSSSSDGSSANDRSSSSQNPSSQSQSKGQGEQQPSSSQQPGKSNSQSSENQSSQENPGEQSESASGDSQSSDSQQGSSSRREASSSDGPNESSSQRSSQEQSQASSTAKSDGEQSSASREQSATRENQTPAEQESSRSWKMPQLALPTSALGWLSSLLKWIVYLALIAGACYVLWKKGADLLQALRELWAKLFGGSRGDEQSTAAQEGAKVRLYRPFSSFIDPFAAGTASRQSPQELIVYTFEALEAWAREHSVGREQGQTAHEFAAHVGDRYPALARDVRVLADLYSHLAYARDTIPPASAQRLRSLWSKLSSSPVTVA